MSKQKSKRKPVSVKQEQSTEPKTPGSFKVPLVSRPDQVTRRIRRGLAESIQAYEDSRHSNIEIVGIRPHMK